MSTVSTSTTFVSSAPARSAMQRAGDVLQLRFADYAVLCRPRIALMSAVAVSVGYVLASAGSVDWMRLVWTLIGVTCFVAASSTLNQVLERKTDMLMKRTMGRPLASGRITASEGVLAGCLMAAFGGAFLAIFVDRITFLAAVLTMLVYVLAYTPLKRFSSLCTTVGAVPGAMPPVLGWLAAGGRIGPEALALFAVFFVWQFPHFLAIGWIYRDEYQRAGLRMLPNFSDNGKLTGMIALCYAIAFVPVSLLPRYVGLAGGGYLGAAFVLSIGYLVLTARFCFLRDLPRARQLLAGSLLCLPALLAGLLMDFLRLTL